MATDSGFVSTDNAIHEVREKRVIGKHAEVNQVIAADCYFALGKGGEEK